MYFYVLQHIPHFLFGGNVFFSYLCHALFLKSKDLSDRKAKAEKKRKRNLLITP